VPVASELIARHLRVIRRAGEPMRPFHSGTDDESELLEIALRLPDSEPLEAALRSDPHAMAVTARVAEHTAALWRRGVEQARLAGWTEAEVIEPAPGDPIASLWEALTAMLPSSEADLGIVKQVSRPRARLRLGGGQALAIDEVVFREHGFTVKTRLILGAVKASPAVGELLPQSGIQRIVDDRGNAYLIHMLHGSIPNTRRHNEVEAVFGCVPGVDDGVQSLVFTAQPMTLPTEIVGPASPPPRSGEGGAEWRLSL
jgi:hypothetical protein